MPTLWMLIGLPGTGKSTMADIRWAGLRQLSTDDWIERLSEDRKITYNEGFGIFFQQAEYHMQLDLAEAIRDDLDIVWDQTNLTKKTRAKKLAKIPKHYRKIAVYFEIPENWEERLAGRPNKTIPKHVLDSMKRTVEFPHESEGFDLIEIVR